MFSSNMDFERVTGSMGKTSARREANIMARVSDPNFGTNIAEIMQMQVELALWSASVGACQNCVKEISDAMKGVIQKS